MYRVKVILLVLVLCVVSIGAERGEPHQEELDFSEAGFVQMHTTAYILNGSTANGGTTRPGICASSIDHIGDIAIVYTLDGNYLGMYECTDTGAEGGGVRAGTVLDVWRKNRTQATTYMRITNGRVWVKWVRGNG
jgi:hypothetical protein